MGGPFLSPLSSPGDLEAVLLPRISGAAGQDLLRERAEELADFNFFFDALTRELLEDGTGGAFGGFFNVDSLGQVTSCSLWGVYMMGSHSNPALRYFSLASNQDFAHTRFTPRGRRVQTSLASHGTSPVGGRILVGSPSMGWGLVIGWPSE